MYENSTNTSLPQSREYRGRCPLVVAISRPETMRLAANGLQTEEEGIIDSYDQYNRPRRRRKLILDALQKNYKDIVLQLSPEVQDVEEGIQIYSDLRVHQPGLIRFLTTAWDMWVDMGQGGRDEDNFHPAFVMTAEKRAKGVVPPMVPCNVPLGRDPYQRPSGTVVGAVGYYCTDTITPIVGSLLEELSWDRAIVCMAVDKSLSRREDDENEPCRGRVVAYAITTHPGHHAGSDSFGGYCYVNHAALAANIYQVKHNRNKVAILDVDYHCGNGTASIFYEDPSVFVISIHCDPNIEYPFHSGFADQIGVNKGLGATFHIPLPTHTTWESGYKEALVKAMKAIQEFEAEALVVSLGLDTHDGDAVAVRRGGFHLQGNDYNDMGAIIGSMAPTNIPICIIQEGGYLMSVVGPTAANVVACMATRLSSRIDHQDSPPPGISI